MKRLLFFTLLLIVTPLIAAQTESNKQMIKFIDSLMGRMTLEEKIGQLNLGGVGNPKVVGSAIGLDEAIKNGYVSAVGGFDINAAVDAQRFAVENSRLGIPLIIGLDVIHGYHTIFPIPLASSCSWNIPLIEKSARIAAQEAAAYGINWTFSPMVDICRDSRWGRIAEGSGEDPYLGSLIGQAMIRGYQGENLSDSTTIMACVKHFALYGASEAGRDYNTVSMDPVTMYNYYLPPYKAAFDEGAGSGMTSFNVVNGVPATGNKWLLTDLLRKEWHYEGFMVSDASSVAEMADHGMGDVQEIAELAINAGLDMDMSSSLFVLCLKEAVKNKKVTEAQINESCKRVLIAKYKLGLFQDPYRYVNNEELKTKVLSDNNCDVARQLAAESIVLLKNSDNYLPLNTNQKIAVVGPLGNVKGSLLGTWSYGFSENRMNTIYEALQEILAGKGEATYSKGANFTEDYCIYDGQYTLPTESLIKQALIDVKDADIIIATVGEPSSWSGEARSRVNPALPECQKEMLRELKKLDKPIVLAILSGRPLILTDEDRDFSTIVMAWHGGTMAAEALSDVLFGVTNPSGKTTTTFPRHLGQIPIYYNSLNTGRPYSDFWATTKYIDCSNEPLYPFGYGLSYNNYIYDKPILNKYIAYGDNDSIKISIDITNSGVYLGQEIVQLYIGDPVASISRPIKELKAFKKIELLPGETKTVDFHLKVDLFKYYNECLKYDWDEGGFDIFIGPNSKDVQTSKIIWKKHDKI